MENIIENTSTEVDVCDSCGAKLNGDWNYCPNCKREIQRVKCNSCLKTVNKSWKYCPYCKKLMHSVEIIDKSVIKEANDWILEVLKG